MRRICYSSAGPIAISKTPYSQLAQHAQAVLEGRWNGTPWRWEQSEAAQLFSHLHNYVGDLKEKARHEAQEQLAYTAKSVARAFMASPDAKRELMPHGLTAQEGALVLAIHCAATIAKHMKALELPDDGWVPSWAECVETLSATKALVMQAALPTAKRQRRASN